MEINYRAAVFYEKRFFEVSSNIRKKYIFNSNLNILFAEIWLIMVLQGLDSSHIFNHKNGMQNPN